ncbi:MAG: hypothetical protein ACI4R9_00780 [Kiritimatiellia bacterium]
MQIQRLDDGDFLVHMDCDLRSVHERKMFVAKDEDGNLKNPENVPIIVRLARSRKMIELLTSGTYKNKHALGDMFGMSHAQISRTCRTAFLSPVIVEKLISGALPVPRFTAVADKLITLPLWAEQHALLGIE